MKLIIAGSRRHTLDVSHYFIDTCVGSLIGQSATISEVVSGTASGIDTLGEAFAEEYSLPVKRFPADWETYGNAAGPIRNKQMADYGDVLLLIWNGQSKGSANMKNQMMKLNKPIYEVIIRTNTYNIEGSCEI